MLNVMQPIWDTFQFSDSFLDEHVEPNQNTSLSSSDPSNEETDTQTALLNLKNLEIIIHINLLHLITILIA